MEREILVGDLKKALENVPDDIPVRLSSDTGIDQGIGQVVVSDAYEVKFEDVHYFAVYANDVCDESDVETSDEYEEHFQELMRQANKIIDKTDKLLKDKE